jgi:hypothetical protein
MQISSNFPSKVNEAEVGCELVNAMFRERLLSLNFSTMCYLNAIDFWICELYHDCMDCYHMISSDIGDSTAIKDKEKTTSSNNHSFLPDMDCKDNFLVLCNS